MNLVIKIIIMQEGDFDYLVCVAIDATRGMSADEPGEVVLLDW